MARANTLAVDIRARGMSSSPIEYTNGKETVKIYPTSARGVPVYQMVYREAGARRRRAFANLARAKREAKIRLGMLATVAVLGVTRGQFA